ncbi:MAG: hypothetical protein IKM24_07275, partial [Clostridia bacterium]|nr:hypothetical protein [Clostridia bacterium]
MKKIVSFLLVVCLFLPSFSVFVFARERKTALPTSAGIQALRNEFDSDVAPKSDGYALDYCYYSPVGE